MSTLYGENIEHNNLESKHHMVASTGLFKFDGIGTIPLHIKYIKVPDYVNGEISYKIKETDIYRLDNIAYKYYGNPELFWVIMSVNNIIDPFNIKNGDVLRILPKDYVEYNILRYTNNNEEI